MGKIGFNREKIERYFRGKDSETDKTYITEIFRDAENEKELRQLMSRQFYEMFSGGGQEINLDHILHKINYEIITKSTEKNNRKINKFLKLSLRLAGMIVLALSVYWGIKGNSNYNTAKETWVEIKAPAWTRAQFSLPDGTTGWLNSNSSVKYNGTFISDRQVTLNGEAFFDVAKDIKRPFKVNANEVVVKVLGTRFNIASYADENNIEVLLEEGKLEFNGGKEDDVRVMKPNDIIVYDKFSKNIATETVQTEKYISWKEGKLVFRNDPIDVIARRLERWYNVEVEISRNMPSDFRLRATFLDESLEEVLFFLGRSLPIDYRIENSSLKPDDTYAKKKVIINPR